MSSDPRFDEEPWEADLGTVLGQMPQVDPPEGFVDAAMDHRPLYTARVLVALVGATILLVALVVSTGLVERAGVVPPIDDLVVRHDLAARAGFSAEEDQADATPTDAGAPGAAEVERQLSLPEGFEREGTVAVEDLRQALYARGAESVSVFVQDGHVDWSGLPVEGLTELDGLAAWVDGERRIAVIETAGSTVTVVGLAPDELDRTLRSTPRTTDGLGARVGDLCEAVVESFGYALAG